MTPLDTNCRQPAAAAAAAAEALGGHEVCFSLFFSTGPGSRPRASGGMSMTWVFVAKWKGGESMRVKCGRGADTRVHWERGVVRRQP